MASSRWLKISLIIGLTLLAYSPVVHAGFVWDDDAHLTHNPYMEDLQGLKILWTTPAAMYYPLTSTTFWIQRHLWGSNPLPYHLFNVALHIVNALLLWALLQRMRIPGAWIAAALFALHPVHVDSVAWVTELKNTQSGFFYLLALLSFLNTRRTIALLLFACALLSKSSTVVFPVIALLCLWWVNRRWSLESFRATLPFFFLSALAAGWTVWEQLFHTTAVGRDWSLSIPARIGLAGKMIWFYIGKLLWPHPLAFIYPRWEVDGSQLLFYLPTLGLLACLFLFWRRRQSWGRPFLMASACFIVSLFPVLGFFNMYFTRYSFVADHFQYLASMAMLPLFVGIGLTLLELLGRWKKPAGWIACASAFALLGFLTWRQVPVYANVETLWRDTLAKNPSAWMAHNNLGFALVDEGRLQEAVPEYTEAIRLNPESAEAHNNLGIALSKQERQQEAIAQYLEAIRLKPAYAEAHNNLGLALSSEGKKEEAVSHLLQAIRFKPGYAEAYSNLGNILLAQNKPAEAAAYHTQAIRLKPGYADAYNNRGLAFTAQGTLEEAVADYRQAIQMKPDYMEAHNNLGVALMGLGRIDEAARQFNQALQLRPDSAKLHYNLGTALANQGKLQEALEQYAEALRLQPDYPEAKANAEKVKNLLGRARP